MKSAFDNWRQKEGFRDCDKGELKTAWLANSHLFLKWLLKYGRNKTIQKILDEIKRVNNEKN